MAGKWHLGYGDLQYPTNRGFDNFFGFLEAYTYYVEDPDRPDVDTYQFRVFHERHIWKGKRDGYCAIHRNNMIIDEKEHLTDAIAREAVKDIKEAAAKDQPFFIYLPFSAPHTPFQALTKYTEKFMDVEDPRKRIYYALITQLDDAVGEVLAALEETGMTENTIVVFTSDNGGATYTGATGNDPLRGGKMSHFEGGISVPLFIKWPSGITPGDSINEPVMLFDLYPSLLDAAGITLPDDRKIDGTDILSKDRVALSKTLHDRPLFWKSDYNHIVMYNGWKLMISGKDGKVWLYNINNDRDENHNLAAENPEIVSKLKTMFDNWEKNMQKPAWPRIMDYYYNEKGEGYWFAI
jgi:arylsulfatase A-like enzyme